MRPFCTLIAIVACAISGGLSILASDEEPEAEGEDSSAGLPEQYAKNYLIARSTISPNKKFAVIYPTDDYTSRLIMRRTTWLHCSRSVFSAHCKQRNPTFNTKATAASVANGRMITRSRSSHSTGSGVRETSFSSNFIMASQVG